jgi:hypothetical protein
LIYWFTKVSLHWVSTCAWCHPAKLWGRKVVQILSVKLSINSLHGTTTVINVEWSVVSLCLRFHHQIQNCPLWRATSVLRQSRAAVTLCKAHVSRSVEHTVFSKRFFALKSAVRCVAFTMSVTFWYLI